ncbi:acyl-CoA dehydrogenase family protein [Oceanicoccus sagamiensis]|uniref:Dibenzothiophene monooxygenase n=1 Tax=Oceanicoccus sagamiensis TaxID=716816 RepID=A0A1X9N8P0_9GAMM|nr:acyl-CoA dehydrogenase family protein [Oceanicoccus sagamiensis]ARN73454.1 acyl-CoA dehydrogenase [Oceanicoccus sagamiensis]
MTKLTGEYYVEDLSAEEREIQQIVEGVLPSLAEQAIEVDRSAEFHRPHVGTLAEAGLMGLMVPKEYGGLGGGLRDLCASVFAIATACPSTAMAYFFQCSSTSRGVLLLKAIEAGLFENKDDEAKAKAWAEKLLRLIGEGKNWTGNFTSEGAKSEKAKLTIETVAKKVDGGYILNGVKSFACAYDVANYYLVTASLEGTDDAGGLCTFIIDSQGEGLDRRIKWDAMGLRGSATDGLVMKDVFVPDDMSLAVPGAFVKSMSMSRGSFVGNQVAGPAVYLGVAHSIYEQTKVHLRKKTYKDTGATYATNPVYQSIFGDMMKDYHTAVLFMRRQLDLETSEPPILPKEEVVKLWRLNKGIIAEAAYGVAQGALKISGTSGTLGTAPQSRALRDIGMALVQGFSPEMGKFDAAKTELLEQAEAQFAGVKK